MEFPNVAFFVGLFRLFSQGQPGGPIIVEITEPQESELSQLSDVLLGSLGLSGVIFLTAILLGIAVGGLVFWLRKRSG